MSVDVCSGPHAFSFPSSARRYIEYSFKGWREMSSGRSNKRTEIMGLIVAKASQWSAIHASSDRTFPSVLFPYRLRSANPHSSMVMPTSSDTKDNVSKIIHTSVIMANHRQTNQKDRHCVLANKVSTPSSTCMALRTMEVIPNMKSRGP